MAIGTMLCFRHQNENSHLVLTRCLKRSKGQGIRGNYYDEESGDEFWVSGVKKRGSNAHWAEPVDTYIDSDAMEEYKKIKGQL